MTSDYALSILFCHLPTPTSPALPGPAARLGSPLMPGSCANETRRAPGCFGIAVATCVDVPRTSRIVDTVEVEIIRWVGHRFGAASPFQPAQRTSIDMCLVDDLDSGMHKCGAATCALCSRLLHKVRDSLHFHCFLVLPILESWVYREATRPAQATAGYPPPLYHSLDIRDSLPWRTRTTQHTKTTTSQEAWLHEEIPRRRSRRTSATVTMVCSSWLDGSEYKS